MSKKVTTKKEIINEINKIRAEIASIKASKNDELYLDLEESDENVYTFTMEQLSEFVNEIQVRTFSSIQSTLSSIDFNGCVDIEVEDNNIFVSVNAEMISEKMGEEQEENDFCSLDEDDITEIYEEIC